MVDFSGKMSPTEAISSQGNDFDCSIAVCKQFSFICCNYVHNLAIMPSFLPQVIYTFHFIIYNECFVCLGVRFNGAIVCECFFCDCFESRTIF